MSKNAFDFDNIITVYGAQQLRFNFKRKKNSVLYILYTYM